MEAEPKPQPRALDNLLELYIKIGGYVGVGMAAIVFAAICGLSYWLFFVLKLAHFQSGVLDILLIVATLIAAGLAAVATFFCASVFWLPILISLIIFWGLLENLLLKLHQWHPHF